MDPPEEVEGAGEAQARLGLGLDAGRLAPPRRRLNQWETSAISGPKLAEVPMPINSPWITAICQIAVVIAARTKPSASAVAATMIGRVMP